jgi:hypothetical protein
MGMRFNAEDMSRLIKACETYQEKTGSEYMWDEYSGLIQKLKYYTQEYLPENEEMKTNKI